MNLLLLAARGRTKGNGWTSPFPVPRKATFYSGPTTTPAGRVLSLGLYHALDVPNVPALLHVFLVSRSHAPHAPTLLTVFLVPPVLLFVRRPEEPANGLLPLFELPALRLLLLDGPGNEITG